MKILLDECVTHELRTLIAGHDVYTVAYLGWSGTKNGQLLRRAAAHGFDALITTDKNIFSQINAVALPLPVIILDVATNDIADVLPLLSSLRAILSGQITPRFYTIRQ